MSESLFDGENQSSIEKITAAKGEQWKDPEVIAKGYLSSQEHILTLEAELTKLKEEATKQDYLEEVLKRLDEGKSKPSSQETSSTTTSEDTKETPAVSSEDIKKLVSEALTAEEAAKTSSQNIAESKRLLSEAFGTEAANQLNKRASELGMSKERLDAMAAESPTAFMALMGQATAKQTNQTPQGDVSTINATTNPNERNWAYYQKMRREDSKRYYTAQVQNQMMEDRERLGDSFGL